MLAATVFAFITAVTSTVMENNTFKELVAMSEMIVLAEVLSSYRTIRLSGMRVGQLRVIVGVVDRKKF
jgi:hypothetical protein